MLRRLPQNGGVVMVTFVSRLRERGRETGGAALGAAAAAGQRAARAPRWTTSVATSNTCATWPASTTSASAADYDGISEVALGLEDVSSYPALFAELSRRGWCEADLRKLAGENVLRAWAQAERVAERLQRDRGPSTATIRQLDGPRR